MSTSNSLCKAWVVTIVAALFFFYEFIQGNMINTLAADVLADYGIDSEQLGFLTGLFFLSNMIFLPLAGMILDRFSTRYVFVINMVLCTFGTLIFALSQLYWVALVCRFVTGIGSAFCVLGSIRLATRWFPAKKLAFATGIIFTLGMLGGLVAQTPLELLVNEIGWRQAMLVNVAIGVVITALIFFLVEDQPSDYVMPNTQQATIGFWRGIHRAYINAQNIMAGLFTSLMNVPVAILGAMIGSLFLQQVYEVSSTAASVAGSYIFLGMILGSPAVGLLSDTFGTRRGLMVVGAVVALILSLFIMQTSEISVNLWYLLFFALGLCASTQVLTFPMVASRNPPEITALAVSIISVLTQGGVALYQPAFGKLLKVYWNGVFEDGIPLFSHSDYRFAMWMLPAAAAISIVLALLIKEEKE